MREAEKPSPPPSRGALRVTIRAHESFANTGDNNPALLVIHIMTPGVIQIPGDVSVGEAARLMEKEQAPCLLIKDTESRIGIVTHADIVFKVVAQGLNPDEVETRRVMSRPVRSIEFDQPIGEANALISTTGVPLLIVTRQNQPIGIITPRDLIVSPHGSELTIQGSVRTYSEKPEGVTYPAVMTQLSHLGAFVESAAWMPPGVRVTLEFILPGSDTPTAVEATVLDRHQEPSSSDSTSSNPPGGVAVQFTDVSVSAQGQISSWIVRTRFQKPSDP